MTISRSAPFGAALLVVAASQLAAQSLRTFSSARERTGERQLDVAVDFAAGRFSLKPQGGRALYTESLTYDEDHFTPRGGYDPASHRLSLGLATRGGVTVEYPGRRNPQVLDLTLTRNVPIDLNLKFGAVAADIDLGGLALTNAVIETGASASEVRFSVPNRVRCESLAMHAGAAEFRAEGLGNAHCSHVELNGGVGALTLDFSGDWEGVDETTAKVSVGLGTLTLRLPRDVGVAITLERFLASFDASGLTKRGSTYYSSNYESADKKLTIDLNTALGSIQVEWIDR